MPFVASMAGELGPLGRSVSYNNATGGTITTFSSGGLNYRRHTFTTAGPILLTVISNPEPFEIMLLGGGGGGSAGYIAGIGVGGASGGGGGAYQGYVRLPNGPVSGTVGGGGTGGPYSANAGGRGGSSTFGGMTGGGGGGGSTEYSGSTGPGSGDGPTGTGGTGGVVSQSSAPVPATFPGQTLRNAYNLGTAGNGGAGGPQDGPSGGNIGNSGAIVVTYQIA